MFPIIVASPIQAPQLPSETVIRNLFCTVLFDAEFRLGLIFNKEHRLHLILISWQI